MSKKIQEHSLSIEIKVENAVRKMSFQDSEHGYVFFEAFLGELKNVSMIEGVMLEIEGVNGILKLDISQQEIEQSIKPKKPAHLGGENQ